MTIEPLLKVNNGIGIPRGSWLLCFAECSRINDKAAYRLLMLKGWFVHQPVER